MTTLSIPLGNITSFHTEEVGNKAAVLATLLARGFPIPDGIVVTDGALRQCYNQINGTWKLDTWYRLSEAIKQTTRTLGQRLAIRSSATLEDSMTASWAGQFESFTDVFNFEYDQEIRSVWLSLTSERARAYARSRSLDLRNARMGVLVQTMIPAEVAGVCFTVNPVTGDQSELIIEAVQGPAKLLVDGSQNPHRFFLKRTSLEDLPVYRADVLFRQSSFTPQFLSEVARQAIDAEKVLGHSADVEWVFDGHKVWIVQARPISA